MSLRFVSSRVCDFLYSLGPKSKIEARNIILKKLANTNWGTDARTIRTTALALCFSAAEYAPPVWSRSSHASAIQPVLIAACRAISGCLIPKRVDDLYILVVRNPPRISEGPSHPSLRNTNKKHKQENDPLHPLYEQDPARKRLQSRHSFLHSVEPLEGSARTRRLIISSPAISRKHHYKSLMQKRGFNEDGQKTWECEDEHTMKHLLDCPILPQPCTHEDL